MKSFPFIVCLVVGVWVGYFLGVKKSSEEPIEPLNQVDDVALEVKAPTADVSLLKNKIVELERELTAFRSEQVSEESKALAAKEKLITQRLKQFKGLFELTPEQQARIGELEWEASLYWKQVHAGEINPKDQAPLDLDAAIMEVLTLEQSEVYEVHLEE